MSYIFHSQWFYAPFKIRHFSPKIWRIMYLITSASIHHVSKKKIYSRGSTIPYTFKGFETLIYTGRKFSKRVINIWIIGFKFGEFTWNRKIAIYKAKQKRKKKKKK